MTIVPKLTPRAACRVARIDRDRFNEHVAAGRYPCAPATNAGRARLFDPDDMIGLYLFRELLEDGFNATRAGAIACAVSSAAKAHPEAPAITYVQSYFGPDHGSAWPSDVVPNAAQWGEVMFSGHDIRKTMTFNIAKARKLIAHYTEEERSIIGEE